MSESEDHIVTQVLDFLKDRLDENDLAVVESLLLSAGNVPSIAADSAVALVQSIRAAEAEVAPFAGEIVGRSSPSSVYREALTRMGHDTSNLPASAAHAVFKRLRDFRPRARALTLAESAQLDRQFPGANSLKLR